MARQAFWEWRGARSRSRSTVRWTATVENACVALEVEDADAYFTEWSRKVEVLRPPRNEPWGARTFDLLDPFGNTLFVMGPVTSLNIV